MIGVAGGQPDVNWFEKIASTVSDQMAYIDRDGVFRAVNRAYLEATAARLGRPALTLADLVDRPIAEILPPDLVEDVMRPNLARCFAGHATSFQRWVEMGSQRVYLHVEYHPHYGADGQIHGAVVVLRDRTAVRRGKLRLRELAGSEALLTGDLEGVAGEMVELAASSLGVPSVAVLSMEVDPPRLRIVASEDRRDAVDPMPPILELGAYPRFIQAIADGCVVDAHEALSDARTREIADVWLRPRRALSVLAAPVAVAGHTTAILWLETGPELRIWQATDVAFATEAANLLAQAAMYRQRRRLEQRLVEGQKREGLGVLAGGLAHDFNNLLVGILGGADLLHRQMERQPQVQRRLELIRSAARRASDLCSQMLAYAGKGRFQVQVADLSELTNGTVRLMRSTLAENVETRLELAEHLPAIEVDVTQIRQVVMNLLLNAAEALEGEPGQVLVRTEVMELTPRLLGDAKRKAGFVGGPPIPGSYVGLTVADSGCGMSAATVERIFDPFFTTKFTGRGLGLAAVLGIVRSHHGTIHIETEVGAGSRIQVCFPAVDGEAASTVRGAGAEGETSRGGAARKPSVLVVDDEEVVRLIAGEMLEFLDCEVLLAENGPEALDWVERRGSSLDLCVLDVTMPQMSGEEVLERIRRTLPDLPVLIASGFTKEDLMRRFAAHEVVGFIQKPYRLDELSELVDRALGGGGG